MTIYLPRWLQTTDFTSFICLFPRTVQADDSGDSSDEKKEDWLKHKPGKWILAPQLRADQDELHV